MPITSKDCPMKNGIRKFCLSFALVAVGLGSVVAQEATIMFQFDPPYNKPLEEYKDQITMNLTVPRGRVSGFLSISIFNDDRSITVTSTMSGRKRLALDPGVTTLTDTDFDDLLEVRRLQFTGVDPTEAFFDTGLPPGSYTICFQLYSASNESLSNNACTNFQINIPVSGSVVFLPPFNVPYDDYSNQVTATFVAASPLNALLQLSVTSLDESIALKKQMNVALESGSNMFSGSALDPLFSPGNFLTLKGITENRLFGEGLPPGNYIMNFSLIVNNGSIASAEQPFTVPVSTILMQASVNPPYDVPLTDLLSQTTLTLSSPRNIQNAYVTMSITGDGVVIESGPLAVKESVSLEANVPEMISALDLIEVEGTGATFNGVTQVDAVTHGLPGGAYSYCFRLWSSDGEPLTQESACASLNIPKSTVSLMVNIVPPYISIVEDMYNMLTTTVTANRKTTIGFAVRIEGDNGVLITSQQGLTHEFIDLEKNIPVVLTADDFYPYFDESNLTFNGIEKQKVLDHALPEGNYRICLTPYNAQGYPLDNDEASCSNLFPVKYVEPPQLLTPECGQTIDVSNGQFVVFNWIPGPGAHPDAVYTLKIVEMRIPDQNPMDALLTSTSPPYFEEQIVGTSFLYGPGEPILEAGQRYAYQIYLGDEPSQGNFINNGFSQACFFSVADNIVTHSDSSATVVSKKVDINAIAENPFPGFKFPVARVTGTLHYAFKTVSRQKKQKDKVASGAYQVDNTISVTETPAFSPPFNKNDDLASGSLPLKGAIVKLQRGHLLYGTQNGESVSGKFVSLLVPGSTKTVATTTTDAQGNFDFTFIQTDQLGNGYQMSPVESQIFHVTGTVYHVYRLIIESPYYCSPDINIVVQPWEVLDLGNVVSYVKDYDLKVVVKTGAKGAFFADQGGGVGITIPQAKTQIKRSITIPAAPENEGQNLPGEIVSESTTDANGSIVFKNLVRHNFDNPLDKYSITCATSKHIGEYNFKPASHSYPLDDQLSKGPYSYASAVDFNSDWETALYVDTITMYPKYPRILGKVNGIQPPAELTAKAKNTNSTSTKENFSISSSNSSAQNIMSTALYNSNLTVSTFNSIFQQNPNWSEMVNKAPLADVKVTLLEVYTSSQFYKGPPVKKLQRDSDTNGQFTFDDLDLQITKEFTVEGPSRLLIVDHPGYKTFVKEIPPAGYLKWGQQFLLDDILLEPDGFIYGFVQDENGNPVNAEVFIGEFTAATTIQSQEFQDILGIGGPLKEVFIIKAPSGGNVKLHIVPTNPIYVPADYLVNIEKNNTHMPQNIGAYKVDMFKHRITLQVTEEKVMVGDLSKNVVDYPPVKNALVKVVNLLMQGPIDNGKTSQPLNKGQMLTQVNKQFVNAGNTFYDFTDQNGYVTLSFTNNSQEFKIEVIPPEDKDLVKKTISIHSEPSGKPVYAGRVVLEKAWSISGTVTYGNDSIPLANARVYIDDEIETFTNSDGKYKLKHIPQKFSEYTVISENHENPLTLVAQTKSVHMPANGGLNFHLSEFEGMEIKELMGIPVTINSIKPDGSNYLLDGAFIKLPSNENFSAKNKDAQLKFHQVPITPVHKNGKTFAKALNDSIPLDEGELDLINYTKFVAKQKPHSGNQLMMISSADGSGNLMGKVILTNSSFQFDEHYMSFNVETSTKLPSPNFATVQSEEIVLVMDNTKKAYIDLFNENSQFRLYNSQENSSNIKTLSAAAYPLQPFQVTDQNNQDYEFKVQDFKALARKNESYVFRDTLVLATTLLADGIPLAIPKKLEINAGNIRVSPYGFEKILGKDPLSFNLEQWQITCDEWSIEPTVNGIIAPTGKINFGLFTTEIKNIKISPNDLKLGNLDLNKFKLGDIVPVTLKAKTVAFNIDNASGSDNMPHWFLSVIGFNKEPAASIKGLPGMNPGDELDMQEVLLLSNGEQAMIIGNQDKPLTFYNIIKVTPDKFTVLDGGLQLSAALDLEIPLLKESYGSFRYTKPNNVLKSDFLGMDVNFTIPGNTKFVGHQAAGYQTLKPNKFDALGEIRHGVMQSLSSRLVKDLDSIYVYVDPFDQILPISEDKSNYMANVRGGTRALSNDWNKFVFSGDLMGMKGVQDSKKRKTFVINGSVNAENEGLDVKNISSSFGGMKITYDFEKARLTGSLDFQQDFSSIQITGHADFLTDADGWLFIAGGGLNTPGFGQLNAGMGIGDYSEMTTLIDGESIKDRLLKEAYNKNLPPAFQKGFSGFYFTALKTIPQLSVPKTGFDFLFVSASIELKTGFDARVWMGFDNSATEYGIGVMAFAELTLKIDASISCTNIYGYLGLQLGVEGKYNTGSGLFSLDGCASFTLAGGVEQGLVGALDLCTGYVTTCSSVGLKATMHFDSDNNIKAGFALGSCNGGNPLNQEIKEKFACN